MNLTVKEMSEAIINREANTALDETTLKDLKEAVLGLIREGDDNQLLVALVEDYQKISDELSRQNDYMSELTEVDPVLRISNRNSILKVIKKEWEGSKRYHSPTSMIMFSVDDVTIEGLDEEALQKVYIDLAQVIKTSTRLTDSFGIIEDNRFVIVVPTTNNVQATWLSGKLRESIEAYDFKIDSHVSCSFGVADSSDSMDANDWLRITEDAYNKAYELGGNRVVDYEAIILK